MVTPIPRKPTILVVDDVPENIDVLGGILKSEYRVKAATDGERALRIAMSDPPPDLILLDIMMPGMDGFEVCRQLKVSAWTRNIPVIFVTALHELPDETKGFASGAVDYIIKPIRPGVVMARVKTHLALYDRNRELEERVLERTLELGRVQEATIFALTTLAEYRDNETGAHIRRTQHYVRAIGNHLLSMPSFRGVLDIETIELLYKSAPLHDIGKVGVPDAILRKPAPLSTEEFREMKRHTIYGRDAIARAEEFLEFGTQASFLRMAREIASGHHERWDGTGYPQGSSGADIPLPARIMAVADVYDALISKRVYKPAFSHQRALDIIEQGRGTHFDPDIVDVFLEIGETMRLIALAHTDGEVVADTLTGTVNH